MRGAHAAPARCLKGSVHDHSQIPAPTQSRWLQAPTKGQRRFRSCWALKCQSNYTCLTCISASAWPG